MLSVGVKVGRLLEVRLTAPVTLQDVQAAYDSVGQLFRRHHVKLVSAADITRATVFSPDVAGKVLEAFRGDNPRLERSGILVSNSAIFSLQIERLIAQADNPQRRCFHDAFEMKSFLGNLLTHEEHVRLARFLAEKA
jgi:hypothetical protein